MSQTNKPTKRVKTCRVKLISWQLDVPKLLRTAHVDRPHIQRTTGAVPRIAGPITIGQVTIDNTQLVSEPKVVSRGETIDEIFPVGDADARDVLIVCFDLRKPFKKQLKKLWNNVRRSWPYPTFAIGVEHNFAASCKVTALAQKTCDELGILYVGECSIKTTGQLPNRRWLEVRGDKAAFVEIVKMWVKIATERREERLQKMRQIHQKEMRRWPRTVKVTLISVEQFLTANLAHAFFPHVPRSKEVKPGTHRQMILDGVPVMVEPIEFRHDKNCITRSINAIRDSETVLICFSGIATSVDQVQKLWAWIQSVYMWLGPRPTFVAAVHDNSERDPCTWDLNLYNLINDFQDTLRASSAEEPSNNARSVRLQSPKCHYCDQDSYGATRCYNLHRMSILCQELGITYVGDCSFKCKGHDASDSGYSQVVGVDDIFKTLVRRYTEGKRKVEEQEDKKRESEIGSDSEYDDDLQAWKLEKRQSVGQKWHRIWESFSCTQDSS